MARVLFINNNGGGFADYTSIEAGTTISEFFKNKVGGDVSGYLIRVNRQPIDSNYQLQDGDRVTITPTKVEGAARVLFINNDGGGFADYVSIDAGTTISEFFKARLGRDASAANYLIRVNRQPVDSIYQLQDGDRVTITPTKVEGAARVLFINNDGGGFADYVSIDAGTTIAEFFAARLGKSASSSNYLIRVNRQPVDSIYQLQDGDRVTITPTKVEGAARVLFVNNDGGGFADYVSIDAGTTIAEFFKARLGSASAANYLIRVNRQPVDSIYQLKDGDRVTITPTKVEGARRAA